MKIGYNKYNITPNYPVSIAGYSRQYKSIGVLDPIEINTLAISIQNKVFILSILDSIIIENSVIIPVKNTISKKYNIPQSQIIIGCIHTHSAPSYFKPFFENTDVEIELRDLLIPQFIESIDKAIATMNEVNYAIQKMTVEGLYGNRNIMNGYSNKNIIAIHFTKKDENKPFFSLLSMSCHPTILSHSNLKLSADLFGALRIKFKNQFHHDCMIVNGCCGDVSTRFYRQLDGEDELERVSHELIEQMNKFENIDYFINDISSVSFSQEFTFDGRTHDFTQTMIPKLQEQIKQNSKEASLAKSLLNNLQLKVKLSPMTLCLTSNIILLGEILIVSLPGDITSVLGKRIEDALPDYLVIVVGYCENYSNYFVCNEDYGQYFETYISRLDKGNADIFIQNIIIEAKKLIQDKK